MRAECCFYHSTYRRWHAYSVKYWLKRAAERDSWGVDYPSLSNRFQCLFIFYLSTSTACRAYPCCNPGRNQPLCICIRCICTTAVTHPISLFWFCGCLQKWSLDKAVCGSFEHSLLNFSFPAMLPLFLFFSPLLPFTSIYLFLTFLPLVSSSYPILPLFYLCSIILNSSCLLTYLSLLNHSQWNACGKEIGLGRESVEPGA